MFQRREALPLFNETKSKNNGVNLPTVNRKVAFSIGWIILSLVVVLFGVWHCRAYSYHYEINCDKYVCVYKSSGTESMEISRINLLDAEYIHIDKNGEYLNPVKLSRPMRRTGYSIRLKMRQAVEKDSRTTIENYVIFTPINMGRRLARSGALKLQGYINNPSSIESANVSYKRSITTIGILCIFFGFMSVVVACTIGQWKDANPKRVKKAS